MKQKESDSMTVLAVFALNTGTGPVQYKVKINLMIILVGQNLKGFLKMFFQSLIFIQYRVYMIIGN